MISTQQPQALPQPLESILTGVWISKHRQIWQMKFLAASELAQFCYDHSFERDFKKLVYHVSWIDASKRVSDHQSTFSCML